MPNLICKAAFIVILKRELAESNIVKHSVEQEFRQAFDDMRHVRCLVQNKTSCIKLFHEEKSNYSTTLKTEEQYLFWPPLNFYRAAKKRQISSNFCHHFK